jgi:hypothetical protein
MTRKIRHLVRQASVLAILALLSSSSVVRGQEDLGAIAKETMKMVTSEHGLTLVWWFPREYWQVMLTRFAAESHLTAEQTAQVAAVIKPLLAYTIVAVVDASGKPGSFVYTPEPAVRAALRVVDGKGHSYRPLAEADIAPETRNVLKRMQPILASVFTEIGALGENIKLYFFPLNDQAGRPIADAKADSSFTVELGNQTFKWRTPVGALMPPKRCPVDGEEVNGAWKFCPWHGVKLPDNK